MDSAPWISAGAAVVSLLGGACAYFQANLSKKAKAAAVEERERAQRAEDRAIEAAATAENHLKTAQEQVHVLAQHLPAIATAVDKSGTDLQDSLATRVTSQPRIEWISGSQYAIVNPTATKLRIENILNKDAFVKLDLQVPFEVLPSSQKTFLALGAWQQPLPDNLILDEGGSDEPISLSIPPKR